MKLSTRLRLVRAHLRGLLRAVSPSAEEPGKLYSPNPAEVSHPSQLCACPGVPFGANGHRSDCEWHRVMCRPCEGTGWCPVCGGDGTRAEDPVEAMWRKQDEAIDGLRKELLREGAEGQPWYPRPDPKAERLDAILAAPETRRSGSPELLGSLQRATAKKYRVRAPSGEVYIVCPETGRYWPERFPESSAGLWSGMDPTSPDFRWELLS